MVFEFVDLPELKHAPIDVPEPLPAPVPDLPPARPALLAEKPVVLAPIEPAATRGTVRDFHPSITPLANESGMTRVTRPKFVPAEVGIARPRPTTSAPAPKRKTGWFAFFK